MNGNKALMEQQRREIGERIRFLRIQSSFSQEKMADLLGISLNAFANIERGEANFRISILMAMSNIFNVSTDFILMCEDLISSKVTSRILRIAYAPANSQVIHAKITQFTWQTKRNIVHKIIIALRERSNRP